MPAEAPLDCLIVGGGAAGLVAAVYLARFRRRVLVVDAGRSRLGLIPRSRNVLGFPDGIPGEALLERLRAHAAAYRVPLAMGEVESLARDEAGVFTARAGSQQLRARHVILATGGRDVEPALPGLADGLRTGHVRYCPVCDGFETQGRSVAVLGPGAHGLRESCFVAGFGNRVTWLSLGSHQGLPPQDLGRLRALDVTLEGGEPARLACDPDRGVEAELADGRVLRFDVLYPALGVHHASGLATALGAQALEDGQLVVDAHLQTTVPGLYAAGDVADGLNQINVAAGHAAIAATAVHNRL
ncbi:MULTISPECIES: NAD(P)/FAD-dependent oxidoreductase [Ramlibacter]|uniref:NAD(P)/FAD-dependent oxidoreductase n=1 Tax=Ramlibacter aquaticus TaxID=2780094 RepID=A0ABR9SHT4_9BURK|nr:MULTISPECIES: NAD(P)/FAD-dependent oxidoreductase [Ramlibacter]MBE7941926.1 NAD(P)/FAD-dependent oxidoreductase [Ramlibacter aquaticus]